MARKLKQAQDMTRTPKYSRIPTPAELEAFNGMHCSALYRDAFRTGWRCPSCERSAHQLVRWTYIGGKSWRERYGDEHGMGFSISMTRHHCHGDGRFPETLICGDCNSADGAAKRKLGLPSYWSFTPAELGRIVQVAPHSGATSIDYDEALRIYRAAEWP